MKKNKKGFFLAETIIVVALVTTVMAFVYPNISKLYNNYKNQTLYYDQTEDLYALRAIYDLKSEADEAENIIIEKTNNGCDTLDELAEITLDNSLKLKTTNEFELTELYITGYMTEVSSSDNYNFNRYLKRMKRTTYDTTSYRLIGVFKNEVTNEERYASIKIDNPNPNRNCNL